MVTPRALIRAGAFHEGGVLSLEDYFATDSRTNMISDKTLSSITKRLYFQAISGCKILTDDDLKNVDIAIDYASKNGIVQEQVTDYYLLWTLPRATMAGERMLGSRTQCLIEILEGSTYRRVLNSPIKRLKTHGQPIDKYVLKAKELGLDHKKVAVCIGALHYILSSADFTPQEITVALQFIIDNGTHKWLRLSAMNITEISSGILDVKGIEKIDLSRTPISQLPQSFFSLTGLKELQLANTKIRHLPDGIGRLRNLEYLNMSSSRLETVSPEIGRLSKLRDVRFVESSLQDLPDEIAGLKGLEYISIGLTPLSKNRARMEELKDMGCPL